MLKLLKDQPFAAYHFRGETYDCGAKDGFILANVAFALAARRHPPRRSKARCMTSLQGPEIQPATAPRLGFGADLHPSQDRPCEADLPIASALQGSAAQHQSKAGARDAGILARSSASSVRRRRRRSAPGSG